MGLRHANGQNSRRARRWLRSLAFGFGVPDEEGLYNSFTEAEMKQSPLGVRASAAGVLAPWVSLPFEVSVGLLPANTTFFFTVGGSFYLH